ncbi:MAG TPA: hypothetical protein VNZ86_05390, partial [Bacteroidia bacterium]|nr:hypothetical protein [Bacteroidia bacterium]
MKRVLLFCGLFVLPVSEAIAQNLIPNPGFEELNACPDDYSHDSIGITKARGWYTVGKASTPDVYNVCNTLPRSTSVPVNGLGRRSPHSGSGFAGILSFSENLMVHLISPLEAGKQYRLTLFVSSVGDSTEFPKEDILFIPFLLTNKVPFLMDVDMGRFTAVAGKLTRYGNQPVFDLTNWMEVSAVYTATGGETILIFGGRICCMTGSATRPKRSNYYYVDDVSLEPELPSASAYFTGQIRSGQNLELKDITFDTGKSLLRPESLVRLQSLLELLRKNALMTLEIQG